MSTPNTELANAKDVRRNELVVGWEREGGALGADRGAVVGTGVVEMVSQSQRAPWTWHQVWISFQVRWGAGDSSDSTYVCKITLILGEGQTTVMQEKQGGH